MTKPIDIEKLASLQATRETRFPPIDPRLRDIEHGQDGYRARYHDLLFICSEAKENDGRWWRHASVSRRDRQMPTYEDLKTLKAICIGEKYTAYQLFVPPDSHIDIGGPRGVQVLHLWACLDGQVTPDFSGGTGSL